MKWLQTGLLSILLSLLSCAQVHAQVDITRSANYLVNEILLGSGVLVGNVQFSGEKYAIGLYNDSTAPVGIEKGIVLTSGHAYYVLGPNNSPRSGWASDAPGDKALEKIAKGKTYDASILEFDFVTNAEYLSFEFVFASEEYLEYVGSKFNDVFAFFITKPNGEVVNIARLPDGITPITVNTVNNELNAQYYVNNAFVNTSDPFVWDVRNRKVINNENYLKEEVPPEYFTQFDGFTTVLRAAIYVMPNQKYHIKMAIADVGDAILDSGVFLKAGSFKSSGETTVAINQDFFGTQDTVHQVEPKKDLIETPKDQPQITLQRTVTFGNVEFPFDQYVLTPESTPILNNVFQEWSRTPEKSIVIKGHTDNFGSDEYNIGLSKNRAQAVAQALINMGVPENKINISFYGESMPIATNDNDFGRARNRRVEFQLVD